VQTEGGVATNMPNFQLTVRHGATAKRYFMTQVEAPHLAAALRLAADALPDEVVREADLAELRPAPDPEAERPWLDEPAP
jgi:hypothetical protein